MRGIIKKAISGFYYVECDGVTYECRGKGAFRNDNMTPLVGDTADFELSDGEDKGTVVAIVERKNSFLRPPIANLDKLFIVTSTCDPSPNTLIIDKLTAMCEFKDITPIIVITKTDIKHDESLRECYTKTGLTTLYLSNCTDSDFAPLKAELVGCISAFTGNTGVGKSSLLNNLFPELALQTADISRKLGRGKHTTRHVELFHAEGGYVADTPGFGTMDMLKYDVIYKDKLELCFREFEPYLNRCCFTGCSHTTEKGCAVLAALGNGAIMKSRHESYTSMYKDAKLIKKWEIER